MKMYNRKAQIAIIFDKTKQQKEHQKICIHYRFPY